MEYIVDKDYENVRLDRFLRKKYEDISLTEIFKGIRTGKVKVNGKKSKENYRLQLEDVVKVFFNGGETKEEKLVSVEEKEIEKIKKSIVYEDKKVLIFNKRGNVVMHKGSGYEYGISEMLKSYLKNENFNFVNRIDKSTSGLIIGAKSLLVARELAEDIRNRDIEKKYYILVNGNIKDKEFKIKSWLKKIEDKVIEVDKFEEGAKESISTFKVVKYGKNCTLLEGTLGSGRTHQLRVQLSNRGNYIIGDNKYGKDKIKEKIMYLFSHYINIKRYGIEIDLPIPKEFLVRLNNN